ncbi:hypothetical protein BFJ63_vAg5643 [Fusarium oxysporum f. sp. narcissi]|uniref:Heme haloperoxidase family profile domain-containing protein n=1 Tax=Fusarium oxysporum f. sp. narcissi TaxID=451672 RepID=A0A4Q2VXR4_FUSOX|nr:hypothetical protein BFJ63_vAg5643 [Fusarium oxysporum f. sp. narcissi]
MPPSPAVGEFAKAPPNASRSPCPVVNALANHGYLERSGRGIFMDDLNASMKHVGMSPLLGSVFAIPTYFEYQNPAKAYMKKPVGTWQRIWSLIKNPYSFFDYFGCWNAKQISDGKKYLNLVDLASHGAIEHDISLSRRDIAQKQGNNDPQQDLIEEMLDYSFDGETLTIEDLARFIKARISRQLRPNRTDDGLFWRWKDERLPIEEGWKRRSWWTMGLVEFFGAVKKLVNAVGVEF